jgi:hypothetical protein
VLLLCRALGVERVLRCGVDSTLGRDGVVRLDSTRVFERVGVRFTVFTCWFLTLLRCGSALAGFRSCRFGAG